MEAVSAVLPPPPREAQRLAATLTLSVLLHVLLVLGV
ncbi:MAG TPA: energy transducer TonB, partial [Stenotrophomonas sp.]|nr:energy transducer TonB [Stenotrophomonas sp.]